MIACFHSTAGFRMAALVTAVPIQIRNVPAASAASVVRPSTWETRGFRCHPNLGPDFEHRRWGFEFEVTTRRQLAKHQARYYWSRRPSFISYRRRW